MLDRIFDKSDCNKHCTTMCLLFQSKKDPCISLIRQRADELEHLFLKKLTSIRMRGRKDLEARKSLSAHFCSTSPAAMETVGGLQRGWFYFFYGSVVFSPFFWPRDTLTACAASEYGAVLSLAPVCVRNIPSICTYCYMFSKLSLARFMSSYE